MKNYEIVPVALGGTGAASAADARVNLDITPANIGAVKYGFNNTGSANAAACKAYWEKMPAGKVEISYNQNGYEATIIFSKNGAGNYGNIIRFSYGSTTIQFLRYMSGTGWVDADWATMDANNATRAGRLSNARKINGVAFDGTADITIGASAANVTFADGETFQTKYDSGQLTGPKGDKGEQGIQGVQGEQGPAGADGTKGDKGDKGDPGEKGADGAPGYTPVKGTDYYTEADKSEMVGLVLAALPTWEGGSF